MLRTLNTVPELQRLVRETRDDHKALTRELRVVARQLEAMSAQLATLQKRAEAKSTKAIKSLPTPRPSIAIVVAYFGPPPLWFPAFLLSCRANPDVHWLIYTDFSVAHQLPGNVTIKHMNLLELSHLTSDALGVKIELAAPYKICDLKPAFGVIFADDLRGFDFWACSDLDVVWGDIRHFLSDAILNSHDIVSSRRKRLSGHFTLFRNDAPTNRTFELIPNVREAMANTAHLYLDELAITEHLRDYLSKATKHSWPRVYWKGGLTMDNRYQRELGRGPDDLLWWRNGKTFDHQGNELMYLHFHKIRKKMKTIDFGLDDAPDAFVINRKGFWAGVDGDK
jgi:hypothetical protein